MALWTNSTILYAIAIHTSLRLVATSNVFRARDRRLDLSSWERIVSASDAPDVLLEGQPQELESGAEPLAVKFDVGSGRLIYTTFHNEAGATEDQEIVLRYFIYLPVA